MTSPPLEQSSPRSSAPPALPEATVGDAYRAKRLLDLLLVIGSAPVWIPLLVVVAIVVRVRLGTPVFFVQERPGLGGRPFRLIKFRTMTDARDATGALLSDAERLTRFGRMLRSTSLDELPELWNVLRGDMSLVGPRPLLMHYLPLDSPRQLRRHEARPGITGLAQVSGRNLVAWPERLEMDVQYVERCSLALDLRILWQTLVAVIRRDGISGPGEATVRYYTGER